MSETYKIMRFSDRTDLQTGKRSIEITSWVPEIGGRIYSVADFEALRDDVERVIAWLKEGEQNV